MASLFEHVVESMPMVGAYTALESNIIGKKPMDLSVAEMRTMLRYLEKDEDHTAPVPPVDANADKVTQRLWGWTHQAATPSKITDLWCRHRDAKYAVYKVLDSLEWGLEDPIGEFQPAIRITTASCDPVLLPLTTKFVCQKWLAYAGWVPERTTTLWKLEELLDRSLVIAFVYDIDANTGEVKPRQPRDDDEDQAIKAAEEAAKELTLKGCPEPEPQIWMYKEDGTPVMSPAEPWLFRLTGDDLIPGGAKVDTVQGAVGDTCSAKTSAGRIVVLIAMSACRERPRYEPGGLVGVARLYPHLMVRSSVPLKKIEATVRYDRPAKTTVQPDPGGQANTKPCCRGYDDSDETVNGTFVADVNMKDSHIPGPNLPFWSNMFAYYQLDAFKNLGSKRLNMVLSPDHLGGTNTDGLIRRTVVGGTIAGFGNPVVDTVNKLARQGEFDNIHMAPKLKLVNVQEVGFFNTSRAHDDTLYYPVDRAALGLDEITMAPFCAHDCFHLHWRWGKDATAKWALGWDANEAYMIAGAPMVPLNQLIDVWLRSPSAISYHTTVNPHPGRDFIPSHEWQVIMHQGAGYAVAIDDWINWHLVQAAFNMLAPPPSFYGPNKYALTVSDSSALFYWWARNSAKLPDVGSTDVKVISRTAFTPDELEKARRFGCDP